MKLQSEKVELPTVTELRLLAAILKAGHRNDPAPDNYSLAADALDLCRQCDRVLAEAREKLFAFFAFNASPTFAGIGAYWTGRIRAKACSAKRTIAKKST
jgi:hypothetical protein